jgi:hypothetical protein
LGKHARNARLDAPRPSWQPRRGGACQDDRIQDRAGSFTPESNGHSPVAMREEFETVCWLEGATPRGDLASPAAGGRYADAIAYGQRCPEHVSVMVTPRTDATRAGIGHGSRAWIWSRRAQWLTNP